MKKTIGISISALTLALAVSALPMQAQQYPQQNYPQQNNGYGQQQQQPQGGYRQDRDHDRDGDGWDAPPNDFNEMNRRAFHDGMDAARADFFARRPMDARMSAQFRRPPTGRMFRDQYRNSFTRGYQAAMQHRDRWSGRDHDHDRDPYDQR